MSRDVAPQPMLVDAKQRPILFETWSLWLQLEPLVAADEDALARAATIVHAWIGAELRTRSDGFSAAQPFEDVVEWMARAALLLDANVSPRFSPPWQMASSDVGYLVDCRGGGTRFPSPYSFRMRVRIPGGHEGKTTTSPFLHVTVPTTHSPEDFRTRALELAAEVRVRWGCAGHGYSPTMHAAAVERIHAHARRHPGFDVTCELDPIWDRRMRTVSWLTFFGPGLAGVDVKDPTLRQLPGVTATETSTALVLQAGDAPSAGDLNRLVVPDAYSSVDRALRAARAIDGGSFPAPWRRDETEAWLRRFERSVV